MAPVNKRNVEERTMKLSRWILDDLKRSSYILCKRGSWTKKSTLRAREVISIQRQIEAIEHLQQCVHQATDNVDLSRRLEELENRRRALDSPSSDTLEIISIEKNATH